MKEFNEFITKRFGIGENISEVTSADTTEQDNKPITLAEKTEDNKPDILYEDTDKREENVKHFRMRDGSFMACAYDRPVHRRTQKQES